MAAGQGGGGGNNGAGSGTGTAPGSGAAGLGIPAHLTLSFSSGPHWGAAALPQSHTVRSLERALEEAGSSGILCLSGRKLRDFPGSGCDLSDTTQAGEGAPAVPVRDCGRGAAFLLWWPAGPGGGGCGAVVRGCSGGVPAVAGRAVGAAERVTRERPLWVRSGDPAVWGQCGTVGRLGGEGQRHGLWGMWGCGVGAAPRAHWGPVLPLSAGRAPCRCGL